MSSIIRYLCMGLGASVVLFASTGCNKDDSGNQTEAPAPEQPAVKSDAAAVQENEANKKAMNALGYMVAKRMELDVGFTAEEVAWIKQGLDEGLNAEAEMPEGFQESIKLAKEIYQGHVEEAQKAREEIAKVNEAKAEQFIAGIEKTEGLTKTASGLYYKLLEEGDMENKPSAVDRVKVNYKGSLIDGTVFDQTKEEPAVLALGRTVPGFSEGLRLVGKGGKIRLYIPGPLGYGANPSAESGIKPGDMLIFDVELVDILEVPNPNARKMPDFLKGKKRPDGVPPPPPNMKVPPRPTTPPPSAPPPPLPAEAYKGAKPAATK